ncbi:MlaD family protein [Flavobacterium gelidilacus]|jgi:phospholipid/cholesterol/gamma-HCH transport system substrate-binding protein|uniref:MlaD family protein n=1 Tax=Flavobacterium gelidilacus TaxID=206041 RepID=UPI000418B2C4|nr:MlaD family protein [Flavobacterium gelidilacus]
MTTNKNTYKVKLGIFVSLGLLILFAIIFFIGSNQNLFSSKFKISTNFSNVSGLQVGGQVRFSGISVGTIENIEIINDSTVNVIATIDNDVKKFIKQDSKASIASEGVIGDKILTISQGSAKSPEIKDGAKIKSFEPVEFDDILSSIKVTAENAEIITDELALLLTDINNGEGTIGKLMNDEGMAKDLDRTMENLRKSSKGLEENMEAAKHNFLLRGYFKKKEREKERAKKEAEKEAEKNKK